MTPLTHTTPTMKHFIILTSGEKLMPFPCPSPHRGGAGGSQTHPAFSRSRQTRPRVGIRKNNHETTPHPPGVSLRSGQPNRSRRQTEPHLHPRRRPRLAGRRLFRQHVPRDAEHRPARDARREVHAGLRGQPALLADALQHPRGQYPARIGITSPACHSGEVQLEKRLADGNSRTKVLNAESVTRLKTDYFTLAEALKEAGYATAHFGKWHLGHNLPRHGGPLRAEGPGLRFRFPAHAERGRAGRRLSGAVEVHPGSRHHRPARRAH